MQASKEKLRGLDSIQWLQGATEGCGAVSELYLLEIIQAAF